MNIEKKINFNFFNYPFFFFRLITTIFALGRNGFFSLVLKLNVLSPKLKLSLKILIYILEKKNLNNFEKFLPKTLSKLGPGFIKLGQALSTRPDIFGLKNTNKLVYLQDRLEPFSTRKAIEIIEKKIGLKLDQVFLNFNESPVAAASVAQVYEATLISGEKVAVKILRPNIEKILLQDFKFFFWISKQIEFFKPSFRRFKLSEMVKIFFQSSINEVDLRLEASSANELKENFHDFKRFKVPKIYWEFTSKEVMVLEFVDGVRIDKIQNNKKINFDLEELTKLASEIFFLQVFRDGFFHADLHPGNIFVDKDGNIIPLDFGIMGRLNNKDRKFLAELLINLLEKNFSAVTKLHNDYGMLSKNVNKELLTQEIRAISIPLLDKPIGQISLANLMGEILSLSRKFEIEIQPKFSLLQKTMVMAEGVARQLNPEANMWELTKPLVKKWIKANYDPFNLIEEWIESNKQIIEKIPEFFHKLNKLIEKILQK